MTHQNPYAPPKHDAPAATGDPELEAIRRKHINTETNVKTLGIPLCLGAVMLILGVVERAGADPIAALVSCALGGALVLGGYWLWRLDPRGRMVYTVLVALGFGTAMFRCAGDLTPYQEGYEFGRTLWPIAMLAILWVEKASTVMTPHYRDVVIPATPHVKRKMPPVLALLLGLIAIVALTSFVTSS
jgi:hypothetical protein